MKFNMSAPVIIFAAIMLSISVSGAAPDTGVKFADHTKRPIFTVTNGKVETVQADGETVFRWRINAGQTSFLALDRTSPIVNLLPKMDEFRLEFRIASGEINDLNLTVLGQAVAPRRHKYHQWHIAVSSTAPKVWHERFLSMWQPAWLPWENADGEPEREFFRFEAMALVPGTVIELRRCRLLRPALQVKPNYEVPITWPVKKETPEGVAYTISYQVVNTGLRQMEVAARVESKHSRFAVTVDPPQQKSIPFNNRSLTFTVTALMRKADMEAVPQLYAEPLKVRFFPVDAPHDDQVWTGELVRPLPTDMRRQVIAAEADIRTLAGGNDAVKKAINYDKTIAAAREFVAKELKMLPRGHTWPGTKSPDGWKVGKEMSEAVNEKTGEREWGTQRAGIVWKNYLGNPGQVAEKLGQAYLLTGDEAFAAKAVDLFRVYAREYSELPWSTLYENSWMRGAPTLSSSRVATGSAYGTNMYHRFHARLLSMTSASPAWTSAVRDEVYKGFILPFGTEQMKFPGGINNMTDISNHNVLLAGITFDDAGMVRWALMHDSGIFKRLADIDNDGFTTEGRPVGYQIAALNEVYPSLVYLHHGGFAMPIDRARVLEAFRMPFRRATLWGFVPNVGDVARGMTLRNNSLADHLLTLFPEEPWLAEVGMRTTWRALAAQPDVTKKADSNAWQKLLEAEPRLFRDAGYAVMRSGKTAATQVMTTLDYGRNVAHGANDRLQFTLCAYGKVFSHGPGSLYNVGKGGFTPHPDERLKTFISHDTIVQNVVAIDRQNQLPAVGKLLAWHTGADLQIAAAKVTDLAPGVDHTRAVALTQDLVIVLDHLASAAAHTYDFAYHNFGKLAVPPEWKAGPAKPLGTIVNFDKIIDLRRLTGSGILELTWDMQDQLSAAETKAGKKLSLLLRQLPVTHGEVYTGITALNNPNTKTIPDATPSLFHRVNAKSTFFATVLEPCTGETRITSIEPLGADGVTVKMKSGKDIKIGLASLLKEYREK